MSKKHFTRVPLVNLPCPHQTPKTTQENIKPLQHGHPLSTDQKEITAHLHKHCKSLLNYLSSLMNA